MPTQINGQNNPLEFLLGFFISNLGLGLPLGKNNQILKSYLQKTASDLKFATCNAEKLKSLENRLSDTQMQVQL